MSVFRTIHTVEQLVLATQDPKARYLILRNDLQNVPSLRLSPFQSLMGEFSGRKIEFQAGVDGFCLSKSNELRNLEIITSPTAQAIYQDESLVKFNTHKLNHLTVTGRIAFITHDEFEKGNIEANFIHIKSADTTLVKEVPTRYESNNQLGAFTVWNKSVMDSQIQVSISHLSFGSQTETIKGSGLMLWGYEERRGQVYAPSISLGAIYLHSDIPSNALDLVAAAIINGYCSKIDQINAYGYIHTLGNNEMGIYNWGEIVNLSMTERIVTEGANACAIINAGVAHKFNFMHPIETKGTGARAFFMYDGHVKELHFDSVTTYGDAATAIQFNRYIDHLSIEGDVTVFGDALHIKMHDGAIVKASADAIAVKYGASVRLLRCSGNLTTHGNEVRTIYDEASIERLLVAGKVLAKGEESVALEVNTGYFGAENVTFESEQWAAVRVESAKVNQTHNIIAHGKNFDLLIDIMSSVDRNIFAQEFLGGVFQDDVVIEYIDNLNLPKEDAPEAIQNLNLDEFNLDKN